MWFYMGAASLVAVIHSLVPDHWVPYVVIARAHHWSRRRTIAMATVGACAHLLSTAAAGLILGLFFEQFLKARGELIEELTGILVILLGAWFVWRGLAAARQGKTHDEICTHDERHKAAGDKDSLFLGAVFGLRPCFEALPIFLAASAYGLLTVSATVLCWAVASVAGMNIIVYAGLTHLEKIRLGWLEQYTEVLAGTAIFLVGAVMLLLGLLK